MTRKHLKTCLALVLCLLMLFGSAQAMRISNNIMALNTHRFYTNGSNSISKAAEKLSSGYRVNRAGDDAAGLAISEKMRQEIIGLQASTKNTADGVSLIQTAEGALTEVHAMLARMVEIAKAAATDSSTRPFSGLWDYSTYVAGIQTDGAVLLGMVERYADGYQFIQFATDGSNAIIASSNPSAFMAGPTGDIFLVGEGKGQIFLLDGSGKLYGGWDVTTDGETLQVEGAAESEIAQDHTAMENPYEATAADQLRTAPDTLQNRLKHIIPSLSNTSENISAAESRISNVDMTREMTELTRNNILVQAAEAMLAQANAFPLERSLTNDGVNTDMTPQRIRANAIVTHTPVTYLDKTIVGTATSETMYAFNVNGRWMTKEEFDLTSAGATPEDLVNVQTKTFTTISNGIAGYKTHTTTGTYQLRQKSCTNAARIALEGKALAKTNINYISLDHPITISLVNAAPSGKGKVIAISYTTSNKGRPTVQYIADGRDIRLVSQYWRDISVDGTYDRRLHVQGGRVEKMRIDGGDVTFTGADIAGAIEVRGENTTVDFVNCTFETNARVYASPTAIILENGTTIE